MNENWIDHELRNWARWANSGPSDCPPPPGSFLGTWVLPEPVAGEVDSRPAPIHEDNAKRVQRIYDVAAKIEKKVLQAEYLWPAKYMRFRGVKAAADVLDIPVTTYEIALKNTKRRVARAFQ
jgi:hypothetical protein